MDQTTSVSLGWNDDKYPSKYQRIYSCFLTSIVCEMEKWKRVSLQKMWCVIFPSVSRSFAKSGNRFAPKRCKFNLILIRNPSIRWMSHLTPCHTENKFQPHSFQSRTPEFVILDFRVFPSSPSCHYTKMKTCIIFVQPHQITTLPIRQ